MDTYNYPKYYEIAFSFRNNAKDVEFLEQIMRKFGRNKFKRILEIACGNCPYLCEWDKKGYCYHGLEKSPEMVRYSRKLIKKEKYNAKIFKADLTDYKLPENTYDMVFVLLGSLYVKSRREFLRHLSCVSRSLIDGGLYIIESPVLNETIEEKAQKWVRSRDNVRVKVFYKAEMVDKTRQLHHEHIKLQVVDGSQRHLIESKVLQKYFYREEFEDLIRNQSEFELCARYPNFDMNNLSTKYNRNIYVLRKKAAN